jgi:accessory colonization factor AcfC
MFQAAPHPSPWRQGQSRAPHPPGALLVLLAACGWLLTGVGPGRAHDLHVYGPGGPHHVLRECADLFQERYGISVDVVRLRPQLLAARVSRDGDIYYAGSECMLEEFDRANPDVLDMTTVTRLNPRRVGIMVRKGNPRGIRSMADLGRPGLRLLDVKLENMGEFHPEGGGHEVNLRYFALTGYDGLAIWRTAPDLDAWVTYRAWHALISEEADFIQLPDEEALRHTPMAVTRKAARREDALRFLAFLRSPEAEQVFRRFGWD